MRLTEALQQPAIEKASEAKSYRLSDVMALDQENIKKNERSLWGNIRESYSRGQMAAEIDQASYMAKNKQLDFKKDVLPLIQERDRINSSDPIEGGNFLTNAMYSVAEMAPAMLGGIIEGAGTGAVAGLGAAAIGQAGPQVLTPEEIITVPTAYAAGSVAGSFDYWRRQGAGALYSDLIIDGVDEELANQVSEIGGALYGAVEFSQINKLMPGSSKVIRGIISDSVKKSVSNFAKRYAGNYTAEVLEEGLQEIVNETAKDVALRLSDRTNKKIGQSVSDILLSGWEASKESAVPMLLLMAPGASVDALRIKNAMDQGKQAMEGKEDLIKEIAQKSVDLGKETELLDDGETVIRMGGVTEPIAQEIPDKFMSGLMEVRPDKEKTVRELFMKTDVVEVVEHINNDPDYSDAMERIPTDESGKMIRKEFEQISYEDYVSGKEVPKYYDEYFKSKKVDSFESQENPEAILMIGPPGAGKSQTIKKLGIKKTHLEIDPDQAKSYIPEYQEDGAMAGFVHKESANMSEEILLMDAINKKKNIIISKVGKGEDTVRTQIKDLKDQGYRVVLIHNNIPAVESAKRAFKRYLEDGRLVSADYIIKDVGLKTKEVYDKLKLEVDAYKEVNANVKFGESQRIVEEGENDGKKSDMAGRGRDRGRSDSEGVQEPEKTSGEKRKPKKSRIEEKLEEISKDKAEREAAQDSLSYLKEQSSQFLRNIKPHKDESLNQEYKSIPNKYKSKNGTYAPDEAADLLGIPESELADYLKSLDEQTKQIKDKIKEKAPKKVAMREETLYKRRFKDILSGMRQGKILTKAEVKEAQSAAITAIDNTKIDPKDKAKFIKTVKNIQSMEQFQKQLPNIEKRIEGLYEAQKKREIRDRIDKELKYTKPVKKGQKAVGKYEYETNKFFQDLRELNKLNQENAQTQLDLIPKENMSREDLAKARLLSLRANGAKSSLAMHERVIRDIKELKRLGELSKNEADFFDKIENRERVLEVIEQIDKSDADKDKFTTKFVNLYRRGFSNIYSMFNSVMGKDLAERYDPEVNEAERDVSVYKKTQKIMTEIQKIYGVKDADMVLDAMQNLSKDKFSLIDFQGLEHEITKADIMDIYNAIKNDKIRERYENAFGMDQVLDLVYELNQKEVAVADLLQQEVQQYLPVLNERHIEITGRDLGVVENYWPSTSEYQQDFYDDYRVQGETPSALKARSESNRVVPVPRNAWLKAMRHIREAEHISNLAREHEQLKRIFMDRAVKNKITNKYGEEVYNQIIDQIDNISLNKIFEQDEFIEKTIGKVINNWVTAKIALNPTVFAKQLLSVVNYAENMPANEWASGFGEGLVSPKKTFEYMWEGSGGFLEQRFNKGYSEAIKDAITGAESISKNKSKWVKGLSSFVRAGDISAIIYGGYPYVKYLESQGMSKKQAFDKFKAATLKSQQSGMRSGLSQFQNRRNAINRIFLAFKNTANQYFRKQVDAMISYANGDIDKAQLAKTTAIYSVINPILFAYTGFLVKQGLMSLGEALFDSTPEEPDPEEIMASIYVQLAINPFMAVPIIDDMANFAGRRIADLPSYKVFSTPLFDEAESAMQAITKEDVELDDVLGAFGFVAEASTGLPVETGVRIYEYLLGEIE